MINRRVRLPCVPHLLDEGRDPELGDPGLVLLSSLNRWHLQILQVLDFAGRQIVPKLAHAFVVLDLLPDEAALGMTTIRWQKLATRHVRPYALHD
jgi:hypothetical protein